MFFKSDCKIIKKCYNKYLWFNLLQIKNNYLCYNYNIWL